MSRRTKKRRGGAMLDMWRPPDDAGDPIGCLATTYTFSPGLFDEQCLGRFLRIESEPDREDLPFLLERETRLGGVYAAVLVDHTNAGVAHSLRWDVLPVRIDRAKQHAKISLLVWNRCVRIAVASANLSDAGYRTNREVAGSVDLTPARADLPMLRDALSFLHKLLRLVPGSPAGLPEVDRAQAFLAQVDELTRGWTPSRPGGRVRQQLVFTLPATEPGEDPQSSLESALDSCRRRGRSPAEAWIASPFFDLDDDYSPLAANLCKQMSRRSARRLRVCVPTIGETDPSTVPRLAAPRALLDTPDRFDTRLTVEALPQEDADRNRRRWHAKMFALQEAEYSALMVGFSNFTRAGMGVGPQRNAEANLLTIVDRVHHGREHRQLEAVWSDMERIDDPEQAEWIGAQPDAVEEEQSAAPPLPAGFLAATYRAGDRRVIVMRLDADNLPDDWSVHASAPKGEELIDAASWRASGSRGTVEIEWALAQPPERLLVRWSELKAFLALNVEDARQLPPPEHTEGMSSDDMLWILAATDPSAAFRAWARGRRTSDGYDEELDSAAPIDLDPLRRYDLGATFLHRVRRRARVLAQLRTNLERPIWSLQALDWRLRGFISPEALGDRLVRDLENANGKADEALLALADFLIVLRDVNYSSADGGLTRQRFNDVYMPFLAELAESLDRRVAGARSGVSREALGFWNRTVALCRAQ